MFKRFIHKLLVLVGLLHLCEVGAIKVKDPAASAEKWSGNAGRAAEEFATNAEASAQAWANNAARAADTFKQAVQAANIGERFRRGISAAGADKFARKIRDVARDRFAPGVAAATTDYRSGVEPYLQTISGLTLTQRKPRGDPANYRRVEEVGKALHAKRMAMLGGGGGS